VHVDIDEDLSGFKLPQWSPATWAGWRGAADGGERNAVVAAMEPSHLGRVEWPAWSCLGSPHCEPQWSPAPGPGGAAFLAALYELADTPQWSPATWAGWSTSWLAAVKHSLGPQWSPATWAGWRRVRVDDRADVQRAAMEPGHLGRVELLVVR